MVDDALDLVRATGSVRVMTRDDLQELNYPNPSGDLYCCLEILPTHHGPNLPSAEVVRTLARERTPEAPASPAVVSWLELSLLAEP